MPDSEQPVAARRARLRLLLRERCGATLREAIVARLAERGIALPSTSAWIDLEQADELARSFSAALESHKTSGSEWTENFDDPRDLTLYLRGFAHQSDTGGGLVLFCDPDAAALRCRMSRALEDAVGLVEADKELIFICDNRVSRGLMIDRIVRHDNAVGYEVTMWGRDWRKRPSFQTGLGRARARSKSAQVWQSR